VSLLPVEDAIARIIAGVAPLEVERVALADAAGRTLAGPLAARRTQPPFPASAMDGYAVRAADAKVTAQLKVIGMSAAGHRFTGTVGAGQAVRIFTGAPVPPGADAVLIQEDADIVDETTIRPKETVTAGKNVRVAGLDFKEGDALLAAGSRLGMREVATAAAMDHATLAVRRRPVVAIIATGDELVAPGAQPGPDQIIASNSFGVAAFVAANGGEARDLGIVGDTPDALGAAVERAKTLPADVLVTLGGASVGDHDLVKDILAAKGMALDFWKIAMRPGKPLMFGHLQKPGGGAMRVLGLPGNPVSSLVCTILFLKPLLAALLGEPQTLPEEPAVLGGPLPANDGRQDYLRAALVQRGDGLPAVTAFRAQDSSMLSVIAMAACLIVRPPHAPAAGAGEVCRIIRLP
jgi:molybdopterin molybdotransferase